MTLGRFRENGGKSYEPEINGESPIVSLSSYMKFYKLRK